MPPKKKAEPRPVSVPHWGQYINQNPLNPNYRPPAAPAPAAAPAAGAAAAGASTAQQSAYDTMFSALSEYGLDSLGSTLWGLIQGGTTDQASLSLALQDTDAWKTRFAGNERLKQLGRAMSPAEYVATERAYAQIFKNYGLPAGFYDEPSDFASFIGNEVSANELNERVGAYADLANREDPATVAQLNSMGMSKGDLLAFMIDPGRAKPLVLNTARTALLGSAARRSGFVADNGYLEQLAARGVTEDQASQGYGLIAGSLADAERLGLSAEELQSEVFENNADAGHKRKRLASQERGAFSGSSGVTGGSLRQSNSGSY